MLQKLKWRIDRYKRKRFLNRTFANSSELFESWINKTVCDKAILIDGRVIRHPPGAVGLTGMLIEIMYNQVYTGMFYSPKPNDLIVDAGANVGVFSLHAFSLCPKVRILAFEPFPQNFKFLVENLEAFGANCVDSKNCALGKEQAEVQIMSHGNRSQDHRVLDTVGTSDGTFAVESKSFANIIEAGADQDIALFKCDIEGGESALFEGVDRDLLKKVKKFAIEFHDNIRPNVSKLLIDTLQDTHRIYTRDVSPSGYGMLYATRKDLK